MKQVGLGRGTVRLPVNTSVQSTVTGPRFATSSSAFNVNALVGRPNVVNGGQHTIVESRHLGMPVYSG